MMNGKERTGTAAGADPNVADREVDRLIELLRDPRSAKRRSAAKELRTAAKRSAAPALCEALRAEINDRRTWETQYQMVMALAECGMSDEALLLVESLFALDLEPMVHLAAGDAAVRLSADVDTAVVTALTSGSLARAEGAIRALAMTRSVPADSSIRSIIQYAEVPAHEQVRFWVAAASGGWPKALVSDFLVACLSDDSAETKRAAQAAIEGRYLRWKPL